MLELLLPILAVNSFLTQSMLSMYLNFRIGENTVANFVFCVFTNLL